MPSPVLPDQFKDVIPNGTDPFCEVFDRYLNFYNLFYQFYSWMHSTDRKLTADFIAEYGLYSIGPTASYKPGTVRGLSATTTLGGRIDLRWYAVTGATSYKIYRGITNNSSAATIINSAVTTTSTKYSDSTAVQGTTYYYWVKAVNSVGESSSFSDSASGRWSISVSSTWTELKPGSVHSLTIGSPGLLSARCWAGGGMGGAGATWTEVVVVSGATGKDRFKEYKRPMIGGGGGGGAYGQLSYSVEAGDVIRIIVGDGGSSSNGGYGGKTSVAVIRAGASTALVDLNGGLQGGASGFTGSLGVADGAGGKGGTYSPGSGTGYVNGDNGRPGGKFFGNSQGVGIGGIAKADTDVAAYGYGGGGWGGIGFVNEPNVFQDGKDGEEGRVFYKVT